MSIYGLLARLEIACCLSQLSVKDIHPYQLFSISCSVLQMLKQRLLELLSIILTGKSFHKPGGLEQVGLWDVTVIASLKAKTFGFNETQVS